MLHITMNLVNTELGKIFKNSTKDLTGLVKPEYLHTSLVILKGKNFSNNDMQVINKIAKNACERISTLSNFTTGQYITDNNGYLMLETHYQGMEAIIIEMEEAFKEAEFDIISKRPFHSTIVKGVFGTETQVEAAMTHMQSVIANENLKNTLCNKSFSMEGAIYSQAAYPGQGALAGTIEVIQAFHKFSSKDNTLDNSTQPQQSIAQLL